MPGDGQAISKIAVRGFKSIWEDTEVEVRPLTLLAGANSSGKSSLIQPLLLLKQTLEAPGDPGALLLDGPCVRFTQAEQLLSQAAGMPPNTEFAVRVGISSGESLEVVFRRDKQAGFDVCSMSYSTRDGSAYILRPGMSHEDIAPSIPGVYNRLLDVISKSEKERATWYVYRERCFLSLDLRSPSGNNVRTFLGPFGLPPIGEVVSSLRRMLHLPGLRGNPQRTYPKGGGGPEYFPGTFELYVASVIARWQATKDERLGQLSSVLREMGLTWKVEAQRVDDTQVELRVGRLPHSRRGGAHDVVSIADVGFGVSQCLPVLLAVIAANPGQVVYLEQPEIHLHPRAQRKLAKVLADAARRGVVVIAETHSALLLAEVQTLVASGALSKDLVKLHWFRRDEGGMTTVSSADLDDNGAYGDWPEDFDDVELEAAKEYLDAVEGKAGE
jgi:hypothetical protein